MIVTSKESSPVKLVMVDNAQSNVVVTFSLALPSTVPIAQLEANVADVVAEKVSPSKSLTRS